MNKKNAEFAPFHGDGRVKLGADDLGIFAASLYGSHPVDVTNSQARSLIGMLQRLGVSSHSQCGNTLWVVLAWLSHHRRQFQLEIVKDRGEILGYYVWLDRKPQGVI